MSSRFDKFVEGFYENIDENVEGEDTDNDNE